MNIFVAVLVMIFSFYIMAKIVDEYFLKSLDNIARWMKLPPSVAGATLLAMGTSAPEISTALIALFLAGASPATGLGTIVGSAIFQILVVIGFAAIVKTSYLNWKPVIRDGAFYSISIILLILVVQDGRITFAESSMFLVGYLVYLIALVIWTKKVDESMEPDPIDLVEEGIKKRKEKPRKVFRGKYLMYIFKPIDFVLSFLPDPEKKEKSTVPIFLFSLGVIGFLSYLLVLAAESFATKIGVPPAVVALTILAGGSSVPELISSAIVSKEGRGDMAIANAIGSNIFDILVSLGLPVFIFTAMNGDLTDLGGENISSSIILLFVTLIMVLLLLASQKFKASKPFGIFLILLYVAYAGAAYGGLI